MPTASETAPLRSAGRARLKRQCDTTLPRSDPQAWLLEAATVRGNRMEDDFTWPRYEKSSAATRNGKPTTTSTMPMMKVGRVPKWWLLESSACARAMMPVTMRMMPRRRLLVLDSPFIQPPVGPMSRPRRLSPGRRAAPPCRCAQAHSAFMAPRCHLLDLLPRNPGRAGGGADRRAGTRTSVGLGRAHGKGRVDGQVPVVAAAHSARTRRNICVWANRVGGTPKSRTGQPAADSDRSLPPRASANV